MVICSGYVCLLVLALVAGLAELFSIDEPSGRGWLITDDPAVMDFSRFQAVLQEYDKAQ